MKNTYRIAAILKSILVAVLTLLVTTSESKGQAMIALLFGNKVQSDKISMGIHIALQSSNLTGTGDSRYLPGFAFGAYTNVKLTRKLLLSNYFIFKSPRGARHISTLYQVKDDAEFLEGSEISRHLTFMELSPLLRYAISPSWSLAAGPQLGIRTLSKDIYKKKLDNEGKSSIQYKIGEKLSRFDFDVSTDLQYALLKGEGIRFNLRFSQGLTNIYKKEVGLQAHNQYFQLGVGIPIGGKKKAQQLANSH